MLRGTVYIQGMTEATRREEKTMEGDRSGKKAIELYGSLWKTRESSISNFR